VNIFHNEKKQLFKRIDELAKQDNFAEIQKIILSDENPAAKAISLLEHKNVSIREKAAQILGTLKEPKALPDLIKLIMKQTQIAPQVEIDRHTGLDVELRVPFYRWVFNPESTLSDVKAARAALDEIIYTSNSEKLIAALYDENPEVRLDTVEVLMKRRIEDQNSNQLIKSLAHVSTYDSTLFTRRHARLALRNQGNQIIEPLSQILKEKDQNQSFSAAWTLYWYWDDYKDNRAIVPLVEAFDNGDVAVAAGAYKLFIKRGKPGTEWLLIKALDFIGIKGGEMVVDYLNSHNENLKESAREWVKKSGFLSVVEKQQLTISPIWGSDPLAGMS
jgi:HEAT repeat protein